MGFFDKVKNSMGSNDKDKKNESKNFKYLDKLIHTGSKKIILDCDIELGGKLEQIKYSPGIKLDVDDLVIDGNGHAIDAKCKTKIFNIYSKVTIKNLTLKNGYGIDGGAIYIQREGDVKISGCQFQQNTANKNGGAIVNWGKLSVTETLFMANSTQEKSGGAINIADGDVDIVSCQFQDNAAKMAGGAIMNWGKLSATETMFMGNSTTELDGGAINIQEGDAKISGCQFQDNAAKMTGGAIINRSKLSVTETLFMGNSAQEETGGAINNQDDGDVKISGCQFQDNAAEMAGGAIVNWGKLSVAETLFDKNAAKGEGGVIKNVFGSFLRVNDCDFLSNYALESACISNDSDNVKIIGSIFSNNNSSINIVFNKNNMEILGCTFEYNENVECIISTAKESRLTISGGKMKDNQVIKSTIHAEAVECSVSNTTFKNNILISSDNQCGVDILNEAKLSIQSPKIADDNAILNKGHIDVRQLSHDEVERIIFCVEGASVDEFIPLSEDKFDFSHFDDLIQNGGEAEITLNEDICLENYELDFYEGGIDLDMDNLTIDGNNHFIDGKHKTRIFNITGKNITLKNLIFKNGLAMNLNDHHTGGGGALRIARNANMTLMNCEFRDCISQDDGGAILNNGTLKSENNKFINNFAEYDAGAIQNNSILSTTRDCFENNVAKITGVIYNNHKLIIKKGITLKNNSSNLKEDIYNANQVMTEDIGSDVEKIIFNTHSINIDENINEWQTFQYLNAKLMESHPILDENIRMEFNDIDDGVILIDNMELDGKDHIIDLNYLNINFKIKNNATIKNLTLKNALIGKDSLFEIEGILRLENVKFLNNMINNDCHLLNNHGNIEVIGSHFYNNNSKNNSLINNNNNLKITNTDFINNHSNSRGSLIHNTRDNKGKVLIENSLFQYNSTIKSGGTIINMDRSVVEISNSKFIKNTAKIDAGAILNQGKLSLTETMFMGNSTQELYGGAILNRGGDINIVGCQFQDNTAKNGGGAIINWAKLFITETLFMGNLAQEERGGAIYNYMGELSITKSTLTGNTAKHGGAIYTTKKTAFNIKNCKLENNKPNN